MIDLTPLDIRKKRGDFGKQLRGYDPDEVDSFLELVAERLEALVKENLTLKERSERLGEQVQSQVGREKAVQEALVTAQELREDILNQARREADLVQREAQAHADQIRREIDGGADELKRAAQAEIDRMIGEGRDRIQRLQDSLQELERRRIRFLKSFRSLLEREMEDVEAEEMKAPMEENPLELSLGPGRTVWSAAGDVVGGGLFAEQDATPDVALGADAAAEDEEAEFSSEIETTAPLEPAGSLDATVVQELEGLLPPGVDIMDPKPAAEPDAAEGTQRPVDIDDLSPEPDAAHAGATQGEAASDETLPAPPGEEDADEDSMWTSTLVYSEGEGGPDDDRSARGH
jgi:DivIVA domain-containing protein